MRILVALFLSAAALLSLAGSPAMADTIAGMRATDRDYTIEGDVVTVWETTFLMNDGTGQVIVDIQPHTTHELGIAGRGYVQVSGRKVGNVFKPLVLSKPDGTNIMFTGSDSLPALPMDEVMRNTNRHRFNPPVTKPAETTRAGTAQQQEPAAEDTSQQEEQDSGNGQPEEQPEPPAEPVQ